MKNAARILPTQQLKKDGHRIVLPAAKKKKKNSRSYKNDMFVLLFHKRHGHYFCLKKKRKQRSLLSIKKKKETLILFNTLGFQHRKLHLQYTRNSSLFFSLLFDGLYLSAALAAQAHDDIKSSAALLNFHLLTTCHATHTHTHTHVSPSLAPCTTS